MNNFPVEALSLWLLLEQPPSGDPVGAENSEVSRVIPHDPGPGETVVFRPGPVDEEALAQALRQTWDWPQAEEDSRRARCSVLLQDRGTAGLPWQQRWRQFRAAVAGLVSSWKGCVAIHAPLCRHLIDPLAFLAGESDEGDLLCGVVNVRLYAIEDHAPGAQLMDTLGLAALGLPDLQCAFRELNPHEVAGLLCDYAYYLYEKGDTIQDGDELEALEPETPWICGKQWSVTEPRRVVLDLYPGPEHGLEG